MNLNRILSALAAALLVASSAVAQEQKPKPQRPTPQDIEKISAALPDKAGLAPSAHAAHRLGAG